MYEELLIGLRGHAKLKGCDDRCPCYDAKSRGYATCSEELAEKAADAIEELSAHYCPHAIRNVHDCGDDSLCRVFGAEPPQEERMNEVRINLNEVIKVKLTDLGKDIYYHQFDELNRRRGRIVCEPSFPKEDAEGYTKFQLWNFMEIYGEHIGVAQPNVIEPLEIVYELPKEEKK